MRGSFLPRLSVSRPVSVIMFLVALLVVGFTAYLRTPINLFPEGMELDRLAIWAGYPNASPVEMEQKVTRKIEEAVATVSRVNKIHTSSSRSGSWTNIEFIAGADMKLAYAELRDRMERVMPEMPSEVEEIQIQRWNQQDIPIMWMVAVMPETVIDPVALLENDLRPHLQRLEGVGNVEVWGGRDLQVLIELDREKLKSHRVNTYELVNRLRDQNLALPGGHVLEGGKKIYVRSMGRLRTVEELRDIRIEGGLTLGDVARVGFVRPARDWISRIDRKESMGIEVHRTSDGNIAQVSQSVRQALEELQEERRFREVEFEILWDQGKHVSESVENLTKSGLWGGLFAALVLFLFLRAVRMTLIITLAIPLSILATLTVLYFVGWSLNIGTMMGLMLSLGLVVDNAIVIVENVYRKRQQGMEPLEASVEGASEVGLAVTMATLTTVVVFLPLILMSDNQFFSFWMLRIGVPVIVGLLASLFIALAIVPLATLRLSTGRQHRPTPVIERMRSWYLASLKWVLRHRLDAFIIVALALASMKIPMDEIMRTDQGGGHFRSLSLVFEMPSGQSLQRADEFMRAVEDTLLNHREEYRARAIRVRFSNSDGFAEMIFEEEEGLEWYQVALDNLLLELGLKESDRLDYDAIVADVEKRLHMPAGVSMRINWAEQARDTRVSIGLYGDDTSVLAGLALEVERRLETLPELESVHTDMDRGNTELQVHLDRERVQRLGVDPQMVSNTIAYGLRGLNLSRLQAESGKELDIWMELEELDQTSVQSLQTMTFPTGGGGEVPLQSLATVFVERTLGQISREDRKTKLSVTATVAGGTKKENAVDEEGADESDEAEEGGATTEEEGSGDDTAALYRLIDQVMQGFEMPRGYSWDKGDRYVRMHEADQSQQFALILAVVFVFLLMGVLFESFLLPLSVIVSIPFAFLGVFWLLYLTGTAYDIMSMIGTVILVGIVVNNAIVLIDLTNRLRSEGMARFDALIEAGKHRFRPILMTSFTTMCGLIPMAAGNSKMVGVPYAPLGRTMMGGLMASMVLTLVIVPLCYTLFDDARTMIRRIVASAFGSGDSIVAEDASTPT